MHKLCVSTGVCSLPFYFGEKFSKTAAYLDLMICANDEGKVLMSQRDIAARWMWHRNTVTSFLSILQEQGIVVEIQNSCIVMALDSSVPICVPEGFVLDKPKKTKVSHTSVPVGVPEVKVQSVPECVPEDIGDGKPKDQEVSHTSVPKSGQSEDDGVRSDTNFTTPTIVTNIYNKLLANNVTPDIVNPDTITSFLSVTPSTKASDSENAPQNAAPQDLQDVKDVVKKKKSTGRPKGVKNKKADSAEDEAPKDPDGILRTEREIRRYDRGNFSPFIPIKIHLVFTGRKFNHYGALQQHIKANIRAANMLKFYTPKQIGKACLAAMEEGNRLGYIVGNLETVFKKVAMCDAEITDKRVLDFYETRMAQYEIEKSTLLTDKSCLIVPSDETKHTAQP